VVLSALVSATRQSHRDYGFPYFKGPFFVGFGDLPPVFYGLPDGAGREGALARWKKWSAAQKKK
jgi:hypothetical protein